MIKLLSNQSINGKEVEDMKRDKKKGFTLIELIVVIAILGILAAVAVPRVTGFQATARTNADQANVKVINSAIQISISNSATSAGLNATTAAGTTFNSNVATPVASDVNNIVTALIGLGLLPTNTTITFNDISHIRITGASGAITGMQWQ